MNIHSFIENKLKKEFDILISQPNNRIAALINLDISQSKDFISLHVDYTTTETNPKLLIEERALVLDFLRFNTKKTITINDVKVNYEQINNNNQLKPSSIKERSRIGMES